MDRRSLLRLAGLGAGGLGLSGCGFRPVYAPSANAVDSDAARELAAVYVPVMPERSGMLLREALQERLERFGIAAAKRYDLSAPFSISSEGVGIDPTSNVTRIRFFASTSWVLRSQDASKTVVKTGTARVLDGVNIIGSQFFASDQETTTAYRHMAATLADQVVLQLAGYFASRPSSQS